MQTWWKVALTMALVAHPRSAMAQSPRVLAISVAPDSVTMFLDSVVTLRGYVAADAGITNRSVLWTSTDARVVSVDAEGRITGRGVGIARVVAASAADRNITASVVVTVVDKRMGVAVSIPQPPVSANNDDVVYFEFQVQKHVTVLPGAPTPAYPIELRSANVEGSVLVQFVVDASGTADTTTIKVLKSTHDLFTSSARATIPFIHFTPAEVGGRKVKQLVQMPFQFSLTRPPPPTR